MKKQTLFTISSFVLLLSLTGACKGGKSNGQPGSPTPTPVASSGGRDFINQTFAGYQGWFTTSELSVNGAWTHWSGSGTPSPGNVRFELYPDLTEYPAAVQTTTNLGPLGNGLPAKLYAGDHADTVNLHFLWMQQYGIDGVALQRFISEVVADTRFRQLRDKVTSLVMDAAVKHDRSFYIEYDISNANPDTFVADLENDWSSTMESTFHITDSPMYSRRNGKPVVAIWGMGVPDRPGTGAQFIDLIKWFKARGVYVIGGVPWGWRTGANGKAGFVDAYKALDMLQPWSVGLFGADSEIQSFYDDLITKDKAACATMGVEYQVVIWPGFSWSNWGGGPRNTIPRRGGQHMWTQALNAKRLGLTAFVANFDEFDEGTAIAKAAENATMIPNNQYFLTLDADGQSLSSDFYLRLTAEVSKLLRGARPADTKIPISPR